MQGRRIDEILYPDSYWKMLHDRLPGRDRLAGLRKRLADPLAILLGYITAFYDTGLYCPYTVSLSTAVPLYKYGDAGNQERFLPQMLKQDDYVWQGATWMTEAGGGSDLGATCRNDCRKKRRLAGCSTARSTSPATPALSWRWWRPGRLGESPSVRELIALPAAPLPGRRQPELPSSAA